MATPSGAPKEAVPPSPSSSPSLSSSPSPSSTPAPPAPTPPVPAPPASPDAMRIASMTALVAAPILVVLPPRKLDLYTFSLCALWAAAAEHQVRARSGQGILQWMAHGQLEPAPLSTAPEPLPLSQRLARDSKLPVPMPVAPGPARRWEERRVDPWAARGSRLGFDGVRRAKASLIELYEGQRVIDESVVDWKARLNEEEKRAIDEGQGVSDRILAQIWAVWNQTHREDAEKARIVAAAAGASAPVGDTRLSETKKALENI